MSHTFLQNKANANVFRNLGAIPIVFAEGRGWGPVTSELPFLALLLGVVIGGGFNVL